MHPSTLYMLSSIPPHPEIRTFVDKMALRVNTLTQQVYILETRLFDLLACYDELAPHAANSLASQVFHLRLALNKYHRIEYDLLKNLSHL